MVADFYYRDFVHEDNGPWCNISSCSDAADNAVEVIKDGKPKTIYRCQKHTSRWDKVLVGPGPQEGSQ